MIKLGIPNIKFPLYAPNMEHDRTAPGDREPHLEQARILHLCKHVYSGGPLNGPLIRTARGTVDDRTVSLSEALTTLPNEGPTVM